MLRLLPTVTYSLRTTFSLSFRLRFLLLSFTIPISSNFSSSATNWGQSLMAPEYYDFGPYKIHKSEVLYASLLSFAMVNLRPVLPDVLIVPKRGVKQFTDLSVEETTDICLTAQKIGRQLERYHNATSLTLTIQDGPQAGQTVPQVHIHIIPRKNGDFENNDEIYDAIDGKEKELREKLDLDKERKDRIPEEMAEEVEEYRKLFSLDFSTDS